MNFPRSLSFLENEKVAAIMFKLLRRAPVWLWLLLAGTQLFTVPRVVSLLSMPNTELLRYPHEEGFRLLAGICLLTPLFIGLAIWRWKDGHLSEIQTASSMHPHCH
jgi:hypothetical protein